MTEHYTVIPVLNVEGGKIIQARFKILREPGHLDIMGNWSSGQATRPGELNENSYMFEMTEKEAERVMQDIGVMLVQIRENKKNGHGR